MKIISVLYFRAFFQILQYAFGLVLLIRCWQNEHYIRKYSEISLVIRHLSVT